MMVWGGCRLQTHFKSTLQFLYIEDNRTIEVAYVIGVYAYAYCEKTQDSPLGRDSSESRKNPWLGQLLASCQGPRGEDRNGSH